MSFEALLGQPSAVQILTRAVKHGRVHHAYRFAGPAGVGKETAAFLLAQALLCPHASPFACAQCSSCQKVHSVAEEPPRVPLHPDLIVVQRGLYPASLLGGSSEASGISVEQIRRIVLARMGYLPHEGRALVVIVRDAHELTVSAANALLKTLEEPSAPTHFVLLTDQPSRLLDTILSRTLEVRFGALPRQVLCDLLAKEGLPPSLAEEAQGSLTRARALAETEQEQSRITFVQDLDQAMDQPSLAAALKVAESRPETRIELLQLLQHVTSVFARRARELEEPLRWARRYQEVVQSAREVEQNASPALVLETLIGRLQKC